MVELRYWIVERTDDVKKQSLEMKFDKFTMQASIEDLPTSAAKKRKIEESFAEGDVPQLAYYTNPSAIKAHVRLFAPPDKALIKYAEKLKDTQTKEAMQEDWQAVIEAVLFRNLAFCITFFSHFA